MFAEQMANAGASVGRAYGRAALTAAAFAVKSAGLMVETQIAKDDMKAIQATTERFAPDTLVTDAQASWIDKSPTFNEVDGHRYIFDERLQKGKWI